MPYTIASFNVNHLSGNSGKERNDTKAFVHIANIIARERFDIIAFQELDTLAALKGVLNNLRGGKWQGIHASAATQNKTTDEYGFIWNAQRLSLMTDPYICSEMAK